MKATEERMKNGNGAPNDKRFGKPTPGEFVKNGFDSEKIPEHIKRRFGRKRDTEEL